MVILPFLAIYWPFWDVKNNPKIRTRSLRLRLAHFVGLLYRARPTSWQLIVLLTQGRATKWGAGNFASQNLFDWINLLYPGEGLYPSLDPPRVGWQLAGLISTCDVLRSVDRRRLGVVSREDQSPSLDPPRWGRLSIGCPQSSARRRAVDGFVNAGLSSTSGRGKFASQILPFGKDIT